MNTALKINSSLSDDEIRDLVTRKYRGKYTYLILSLLYPGRDWKDTVFHEDHIFPAAGFGRRDLQKRIHDPEKMQRYESLFDTVVNLELLTDTENLSKNATPFNEWIATRDEGFKKRHLIPEMKSYDLDFFEEFVVARRQLLENKFKAI